MFERFKRKIQPVINIYHLIKAVIANVFFGFPSRRIKVIGITGTDGKTTTAHLIYHILKSAGKKVSLVSSIYAKVGDQVFETGLHITSPGAFLIQKFLSAAVSHGDEYFVLETTSHALDQNRVYGVNFQIGVITNVAHEHLDYHKTYERYLTTKAKLLKASMISVINRDDQSYGALREILSSKEKVYNYGLENESNFKFNFKNIVRNITDYNNYNYLAAYSVCMLLKITEDKIVRAVRNFKLPRGRLEIVYNGDFKVIVDFAHTPNSFDNLLPAIRTQYLKGSGRIIHVFGAAALRDTVKRPIMGEISAKYSDIVILTEEDYREEDPQEICRQIAVGLMKQDFSYVKDVNLSPKQDRAYTIIVDRSRAIRKAVELARLGDVVVLTGKSHEKSLCRGRIEYPWDEYEAVHKAVKRLI